MAQALSEHERAAQLAALQSLLVPVALQQHAGASVSLCVAGRRGMLGPRCAIWP